MKTLFITFLSLAGLLIVAKPYSMINNQHTAEGCTYYDVAVWDDNGTPGDRTDDFLLAEGTLNDCTDKPAAPPASGNTEGVEALLTEERYYPEHEFTVYWINIINEDEESVAYGSIVNEEE